MTLSESGGRHLRPPTPGDRLRRIDHVGVSALTMRRSEQQSVRRRLATALSGLVACLASTILAEGFGLNGPQYDGWVRTFSIFAVVSIPWTLAAMFFPPRLSPVRIAC